MTTPRERVGGDHIHPGLARKLHNHDDVYYTEAEVDSALAGKSNTGHNHDARYYTETEADGRFLLKSKIGYGKVTATTDAGGQFGIAHSLGVIPASISIQGVNLRIYRVVDASTTSTNIQVHATDHAGNNSASESLTVFWIALAP